MPSEIINVTHLAWSVMILKDISVLLSFLYSLPVISQTLFKIGVNRSVSKVEVLP